MTRLALALRCFDVWLFLGALLRCGAAALAELDPVAGALPETTCGTGRGRSSRIVDAGVGGAGVAVTCP